MESIRTIGFTCCECYFDGECSGNCAGGENIKEVGYYKCHKAQIESLIKEAEKRHRENGGLVVCDHAEECVAGACVYQKPHNFIIGHPNGWVCEVDLETECKFIAYRGEQAKEGEGQEYVVVKDITFRELANSDNVDASFFLSFVRASQRVNDVIEFLVVGQAVITGNFPYEYKEELEKLGFIEKVVHDPVVRVNDVFKRTIDNYRFMLVSSGSGKVILTGIDNNAVYVPEEIFCIGDKLSKFIGKENLKDFKPVKIKITEVEEG